MLVVCLDWLLHTVQYDTYLGLFFTTTNPTVPYGTSSVQSNFTDGTFNTRTTANQFFTSVGSFFDFLMDLLIAFLYVWDSELAMHVRVNLLGFIVQNTVQVDLSHEIRFQ